MTNSEYAILGAGSIGSILGAHLARAGHDVVMLAREKRAKVIELDGLRIKGLTEFSTPVQVLRDASQLSTEVLIVATKAPDTIEALKCLRRDAAAVVFSIQNGLLKNELLQATFGSDRVLGALADTSGEMLPNGEILFTRNVNIHIGELAGATGERTERICRTIDESGIRATPTANIVGLEWSKFCAWAGMMVMGITTRASTWKYLSQSGSARVIVQLVRELGNLANALNVELTDQSVLPVASMCSASEADALKLVLQLGARFHSEARQHRMSSLQDLDAGRPLEIEETLGYAHRKALESRIAAPLLDALYHLASAIDFIQRGEQLELLGPRLLRQGEA